MVLTLFILWSSIGHAQQADFDFRKTSWGMAKDQVKAAESEKLSFERKNDLFYETSVANLATFLNS